MRLKYLLLFVLLTYTLNADIFESSGSGTSKEKAIENAKQKAVTSFIELTKNSLEQCQNLDLSQAYDASDFIITPLSVTDIKLSTEGYTLKAEFDFTVKEHYLTAMKKLCAELAQDKMDAQERSRFYKNLRSQFHYGVGAFATFGMGLEVFVEYRPSKIYSFYTTLSYNRNELASTDEEVATDNSVTLNLGIEYRYQWLLLGYDYVLHSSYTPEYLIKNANSAFKIGLSFDPMFNKRSDNSPFDAGFYYKSYNDELIGDGSSSMLVWYGRYKF